MADIGTKNASEPDLTSRIKYIMVRLEKLKTEHLYKRGDSVLDSYEEQEF